MCEGPLLKKIIVYTIPIICTGVLQLLFNAADLVVVGRFCGSVSVASVGATAAIINLIVNLFIGLSIGSGVCVAHAIGANNTEEVYRVVHTAIPLAFFSGILLTVVGVILTQPLLTLMGTPDNVIRLSTMYMKIYFCGMTFNMIYNFGGSILRAAGDTRSPLIILTLAGILNVLLNVFFVTVFRLNVAGVALATTMSQALSAVLVLIVLSKRTDSCRLYLRQVRLYPKQIVKMLHIGIPAGIQGSLFSISNVIIQSSVNSFGSIVMSGNASAQNIEGFVYISMNSFYQSSLNFTGQNIGAKKYTRVWRIVGICLIAVFVVGTTLGLSGYFFGNQLLSIYITDSLESIAYGKLRMGYVCRYYFLCGLMDVMNGAIRGMGASITPMLVTVIGVCGMRIGWIYTIFRIPQFHTLDSLYVSYPISWLITFLANVVVFLILMHRRLKGRHRDAPEKPPAPEKPEEEKSPAEIKE